MTTRCGVDIIEVSRIKDSIEKFGETFLHKIFTENEVRYCESRNLEKFKSYAARFAAKEAVVKAMGTGFTKGISFKDIEVLNNDDGAPHINLFGKAREVFCDIRGKEISISISHCIEYAVAYTIINKG